MVEELAAIGQHVDAARRRISSISYTAITATETRDGKRIGKIWTIKQQSESIASVVDYEAGDLGPYRRSAVRNPSQIAWTTAHPPTRAPFYAEHFEVRPDVPLPREAYGIKLWLMVNIFEHGFGAGKTSDDFLTKLQKMTPNWRVQRQGETIELRGRNGDIDVRYVVDAARGHLVTTVEVSSKGVIRNRETCRPVLLGNDIWLPGVVDIEYLDAEGALRTSQRFTFTDFMVNHEMPQSDFTIAGLQLPDGATVRSTAHDGTTRLMIWRAGRLVERQRAPQPEPAKEP